MNKKRLASVAVALAVPMLIGTHARGSEPSNLDCGAIETLTKSESTAPITVNVWVTAALLAHGTPSPCVAWLTPRYGKLVTVGGALTSAGGAAEILERFGAVSRLRGLAYWSVSDHRLEPLILNTFAIDEPRHARQRPDFSADEMLTGQPLFFSQQDNRATGRVVYKMTVSEATDDRIVLNIENTNAVRLLLFTLFAAGDLRSTYVLERLSGDLWRYTSFTGVHENQLVHLQGGQSDKSYSNRALALYGSIARLSADIALPWAK